MERVTFGGATLVVYDIDDGTELNLYRVVRGDRAQAVEFLDSFRSHYELGAPPRRHERRSTIIHMGLSTYRSAPQAVGTARRFPRIGSHVAQLRLVPDEGFNFADTGHPGHVTVWGDPFSLARSVIDIQIVDR
ncbi:MAG: hypothetical protein ACR2ND_11240 [Solirubrobacteraceae bacterium]